MRWSESFLQGSSQIRNCWIIQVRDGGYEGSPLLGNRYCGNSSQSLTSTQNMMWIRYVTDGSDASTGFQASYDRTEPCMCLSLKGLSQTDIQTDLLSVPRGGVPLESEKEGSSNQDPGLSKVLYAKPRVDLNISWHDLLTDGNSGVPLTHSGLYTISYLCIFFNYKVACSVNLIFNWRCDELWYWILRVGWPSPLQWMLHIKFQWFN